MVFKRAPGLFSLVILGPGCLWQNHGAYAKNMNQGGRYKIANSETFDTEYADDREYFDVYSKPIKTLYSQVHWISHRNIKLPQEIVERFEGGKLMAVTGYEVDQVRITDSGEEIPVPITWAYNHHYGANLVNSRKMQMVMKPTTPDAAKLGLAHGASHHLVGEFKEGMQPDDDDDTEIPQIQFFSEANGGEFRMSYHSYPKGYAQTIESPNEFVVTPMQIDTWNRNMKNHTYLPGPLPSSSRIPHDAGYNGLLECPCSDRIPFEWGMTYAIDEGSCHGSQKTKCKEVIQNATECFTAVEYVIKGVHYDTQTIDDESLPSGCTGTLNGEGIVQAVWNKATVQSQMGHTDLETNQPHLVGVSLGLVNMTVAMDPTSEAATSVQLKLTGPADKWFGVGFGSKTMCVHMEGDECPGGGPYAIIISGDQVEERKLDHHGAGIVLDSSITVHSNQVDGDTRTVTLSRPLKGPTANYYTFDSSSPSIPLIMANGCSLKFAQHCGHGPNEVNLLPVDTPKKLCQSGIQGTIDGLQFDNDRCAPFPNSDLLDQSNPTCDVQTYKGGLSCCRNGKSLLDKAQEIPWQDQPLEYRLKFRFYFEEYKKSSDISESPSHQQLIRLYWQTEAHAGEYDIVQCREGTPSSECIQTITSRWTVRDMTRDCPIHDASWCTGKGSTDSSKTDGVKLIYAGPHCHAPHCLSMELYNADTGQLLCHMEPIHGSGEGLYDEHGYLAIPPCLWGDTSEGLDEPQLLSLDTTLMSIKRNNSTLPHTGEMASWQMRGILVRKEEEKEDDREEDLVVVSRTSLRRTGPVTVNEEEGLH
ncbi:unnamed protein product [Cylindrotheca closterium]|uniref:Uncharacterized protein n=1 Tax=Cylindrotheca closterium TaxID=2856 RepID=A0AAD2FCS5_9STRA|nr:unnamed protein product [Cylindrotheca closterium]